MANKFDLMKDKPALDIPTLNYVWDMLWRRNRASNPKNAYERASKDEQERILKMLESLE